MTNLVVQGIEDHCREWARIGVADAHVHQPGVDVEDSESAVVREADHAPQHR